MRKWISFLLSCAMSCSLVGVVPASAYAESYYADNGGADAFDPSLTSPDVAEANSDEEPVADSGEADADVILGEGMAAEEPEASDEEPDAPSEPTVVKTEVVTTAPVLAIKGHVQNIGDVAEQRIALNGKVRVGTQGRGLRLESFSLRIVSPATKKTVTTYSDGTQTETPAVNIAGDVEYSAHVQNIGWQKAAKNGAVAGTSKRSLRIEAVTVRLTGDLANYYDVQYLVHVQNIGDLSWTKTGGSIAGTTGASLRVENILITLVEKGKGNAVSGASAIPQASATYRVHVQNIGDQGVRSWGSVAGTTGRSLRLESLRITAPTNTGISGGIEYRSHVQNIGWQNWVSNGAESGTHGRSLRMEAVSIRLTGDLAKYYNVYYRAHVQNFGWLGWASNGQNAGSTGYAYRLEGIQICLVAKGGAAPGSTANCFIDGAGMNATQKAMMNRINRYPSKTNYAIGVDASACRVGVFQKINGAWRPIKWYVCAPGAANSPTVKGVFEVQARGYSFGSGFTCYYWTQFHGNYLFHSIKYRQGTFNVLDPTLGRPASHGCVRLDISEAKWIYDNIPRGTRVISY